LAKLLARKLIASRAQCVCALSFSKTKNSPDILSMARNSCCWLFVVMLILTWLR